MSATTTKTPIPNSAVALHRKLRPQLPMITAIEFRDAGGFNQYHYPVYLNGSDQHAFEFEADCVENTVTLPWNGKTLDNVEDLACELAIKLRDELNKRDYW